MRTRKEGIKIIKLRGHHLVCLHFYSGEGYDENFRAALRLFVDRARGGAHVMAVSGPDDVCLKCPHLKNNICAFSETSEGEINDMDAAALGLLAISPGEELKWGDIRDRLPDFFRLWQRSYCAECGWRPACLKSPLWRELGS